MTTPRPRTRAKYEFIVAEPLNAVGYYTVIAATRDEALQKVLSRDASVATMGDPELWPSRPMTVRDVRRGARVR